jgi:hypothetical protein
MFLIELFGLNADADSSPKIRHWENEIIYADFFLFFQPVDKNVKNNEFPFVRQSSETVRPRRT